MHDAIAAHRISFAAERDESAVGQCIDVAPVQALAAPAQAFAVQHLVHLGGIGPLGKPAGHAPCLGKGLRLFAATLETGPVAGGQRGRLVEKKQLGIKAAPNVALASLEFEHAANPLPRLPAPCGQRLGISVKPPAAVAEKGAARRSGKQRAEWVHPILQRHRQARPVVQVSLRSSQHRVWAPPDSRNGPTYERLPEPIRFCAMGRKAWVRKSLSSAPARSAAIPALIWYRPARTLPSSIRGRSMSRICAGTAGASPTP